MFQISALKKIVKSYIFKLYVASFRIKENYFLRSVNFFPASGKPKVFLGFQKKNSGGGLKLRDLEIYGSDGNSYNIVYLLSSSLPYNFKEIIVKAKKAGSKIIWNQNGIGFPAWAGAKHHEINKAFKTGIEAADIVVFQSDFARTSVHEMVANTDNLKKKVIYNAINTQLFKPRISKETQKLEILIAGSHNDVNRVIMAILVVSSLWKSGIDCVLKIAGKIGVLGLKKVQDTIVECNMLDRVVFLGSYGREEAPGFFANADILLHLQPFDNCPTVVIEAMASGLMVVGPNNGGVPELLGEELSFQLVPNLTTFNRYDWGNPEQYAEKIISLIPLLDSLKIKARERAVNCFDLQKWIQYHQELFYF